METVHSAPADPAFEVQATEAAAEGQRGDAVTPARAGTAADASAAAEVAGPASPPADRYVDAELDGLALKLDAHSQNLRAELLMHLADCQRRAEQRQRAAVAAVASGAARELAAKEQVESTGRPSCCGAIRPTLTVHSSRLDCIRPAACCICQPVQPSRAPPAAAYPLPHRSWPAQPPSWSGSAKS